MVVPGQHDPAVYTDPGAGMPDGLVHSAGVSDSEVRCPVHGTPAAYWHAAGDWTCTVPDCGYGCGIATADTVASAILAALSFRHPRPAGGGRLRQWLRRRRRRPRY